MRPYYFNPQGPRGPRPSMRTASRQALIDFNPQGPRGPRQPRIHKKYRGKSISIHKALAGLDIICLMESTTSLRFQSTRPSRASTYSIYKTIPVFINFNPQGPRGPRRGIAGLEINIFNFNPQGPRGPRLPLFYSFLFAFIFQSTRPSRASTDSASCCCWRAYYFNPQGPRGPRHLC